MACKDDLSLELGNCFFECESKNQTSYFQRFTSYDYASEGCTACEERCKEDFENGFLDCPCQVRCFFWTNFNVKFCTCRSVYYIIPSELQKSAPNFKLKWRALSWCLISLYCCMRNSGQMSIGKT